MNRCKWCNMNNPLYVSYHDTEWGILKTNDQELYELLILEMFQTGLSWEIVLNKRKNFEEAYANFDINKVINYGDEDIKHLIKNKGIIRNKKKIMASIENSKIFKSIVLEYGSFYKYLCKFTNGLIIKHEYLTKSSLSDSISSDLKMRGMKYVGSVVIYSYLEAIGVIDNHQSCCFKCK